MKTIIKYRWIIFALWIVGAIGLTIVKPDVNAIIRERGQSALADDSPSVVASQILEELEVVEGTSDLIVFYSEDGLSESEMNEIGNALGNIGEKKDEFGITQMIDPFTMPEAASALISEDKTTLMVSITVDIKDMTVDELKEKFDVSLEGISSEYYLSGEDFINNDYQTKSEEGVEKSAILTVLFILIVLMLVFRSVITPLISLLGVVLAYLSADGIAALLIDKGNFPVTSLTTMLLILVLFGIGTDYNILLFSRFKEELAKGSSIDESIITTYKTAGKTIVFSIVTVLIAFAALVFAQCPIYKSGTMIVVGTIMLLFEILTVTPFFMKVLGKKLFWPSKNVQGHKESKLWGGMATIAGKNPVISLIIVVIIMAPLILSYKEKLSFDLVGELGDISPSSKGFNIVAEHFGAGQMMTTTIVIKDDKSLLDNESLQVIDELTEEIGQIQGVDKSSSLTRPEGEKIDMFYLGNQLAMMGQELQGEDSLNIPEGTFESEQFAPVVSMFMSDDNTITKLTITLGNDPYSEEAQETVVNIKEVLENVLKGSVLEDTEYGVSGTTATTKDTNDVLSDDLQRTALIVVIGVFIVLIIITRSVWTSGSIIIALVSAYFASSAIVNFIFINIKGLSGISSFVPFFTFIIIIALGVDYSIFLMMRFKEYKDMPVHEAMAHACKHIGGVVLSAIVILGGTFATLIPSGMILLQELAIGVIGGLVLLCFVLLPVFIPAAVSIPEKIKSLKK